MVKNCRYYSSLPYLAPMLVLARFFHPPSLPDFKIRSDISICFFDLHKGRFYLK